MGMGVIDRENKLDPGTFHSGTTITSATNNHTIRISHEPDLPAISLIRNRTQG